MCTRNLKASSSSLGRPQLVGEFLIPRIVALKRLTGLLFGRVAGMETRRWTRLKNSYQRWLPLLLFVTSAVWLVCVRLFHSPRPPVGTYIAFAGAMAVVITLWPPESNWRRAGWLATFFVATGLEIVSLYKERADNQQAFSDTLTRLENLYKQSKENSDEVTGGESFIVADVLAPPVNGADAILFANVVGSHTVRQVSYAMAEGCDPVKPTDAQLRKMLLEGNKPTTLLGDMATPFNKRLAIVHPALSKVTCYSLTFFALNGAVNEKLYVRFNRDKMAWGGRVLVKRGNTVVLDRDWDR